MDDEGSGVEQRGNHLAGGRSDDRQGEKPSARDRTGQHVCSDQIASARTHEHRESAHGGHFDHGVEKVGRPARTRIGQKQQVEGCQQKGDDEQSTAGGGQFPVMQRVLAGTENCRSDAGEQEEGEVRQFLQRAPQGEDERDRAADDQEPAGQLAPEDVSLVHELAEDLGQRAPRRDRCGSIRG